MPRHEEVQDFLSEFLSRIRKMEQTALETGLEEKVSMSEIHVIDKIGTDGSAKMSAIAKALGITLATLTVTCDKLERKGLVTRRKDETDKRTVGVFLTAKGITAYRFHRSFLAGVTTAMLDGMGKDEQELLFSAVSKLNKYFFNTSEEL